MDNQNMDNHRSDRPSGRQAAEQPEHSGSESPSTESLHQGQGPDLISQDQRVQKKNKGIQELDKGPGRDDVKESLEQSVGSLKSKEDLDKRGEDLHDPESDQ